MDLQHDNTWQPALAEYCFWCLNSVITWWKPHVCGRKHVSHHWSRFTSQDLFCSDWPTNVTSLLILKLSHYSPKWFIWIYLSSWRIWSDIGSLYFLQSKTEGIKSHILRGRVHAPSEGNKRSIQTSLTETLLDSLTICVNTCSCRTPPGEPLIFTVTPFVFCCARLSSQALLRTPLSSLHSPALPE